MSLASASLKSTVTLPLIEDEPEPQIKKFAGKSHFIHRETRMGNCSWKGLYGEYEDSVRVLTESGGIMEFEGPLQVTSITENFPGYGIFRPGNVSLSLPGHAWLPNGQLFYLLPLSTEKAPLEMDKSPSLEEEAAKELTEGETLGPVRVSSGEATAEEIFRRPSFEVLPSKGRGMWRVRLVMSREQLAEILAEQSDTEALIESMRLAAVRFRQPESTTLSESGGRIPNSGQV
ncbi:uncharacterized protein LOC18442333 [Amborella trichopoda]|nr:uncharacterized protein LOC18442333 [Amborella trichopoda]|eukprot:XP_020527956.1 uncharacterized protein LOC18442333 [Amborella trichopoda]